MGCIQCELLLRELNFLPVTERKVCPPTEVIQTPPTEVIQTIWRIDRMHKKTFGGRPLTTRQDNCSNLSKSQDPTYSGFGFINEGQTLNRFLLANMCGFFRCKLSILL